MNTQPDFIHTGCIRIETDSRAVGWRQAGGDAGRCRYYRPGIRFRELAGGAAQGNRRIDYPVGAKYSYGLARRKAFLAPKRGEIHTFGRKRRKKPCYIRDLQ